MDAQQTKHVSYKLAYHFIWCPKYRKRILTGTSATWMAHLPLTKQSITAIASPNKNIFVERSQFNRNKGRDAVPPLSQKRVS
jgi:REP element-mobilizing transposase RayT